MSEAELDNLIALLQKLKPFLQETHAPRNVIHAVTAMRIATTYAREHAV